MGIEIAGLLEVGPFTPPNADGRPGTRSCDLCGDWDITRTYYVVPVEVLSVCERCVEAYLADAANGEQP